MIEAFYFAAGIAATLTFARLRRHVRAARARQRMTQFLTPRILTENTRRDRAIRAASDLPTTFWQGRN